MHRMLSDMTCERTGVGGGGGGAKNSPKKKEREKKILTQLENLKSLNVGGGEKRFVDCMQRERRQKGKKKSQRCGHVLGK